MYPSFDAFEYVEYLRRRWRVVGVACVVAIILSLGISLLLPKRYTATASIIIEPPGSNDVRTATAVSQIYLESLKTYERFATSDSLFASAVEKFHLQENGSIESLKRRVLKVAKIRDTKILEIDATLEDPKQAQSLAQFLAEETVKLSRSESLTADRETIEEAQKREADAQLRLERAQKAWASVSVGAPVEALQGEIDANVELQSKVREQFVRAQADAAEYQQQAQTNGQFAREQLQSAKARASSLERQLQDLDRGIQAQSAALASRTAKRQELQAELRMAQAAVESEAARLRDLRASAGTRGERLRVIDPGIIPQRPSSPNIPLNVGAALLLALLASVVYLSLAFVYRRKPVGFEPAVTRGMRA